MFLQPSISSVTTALESAIQRLKNGEFLPPETCHEMIKKMYTWQDIARRTEIVYDQQTVAGRRLLNTEKLSINEDGGSNPMGELEKLAVAKGEDAEEDSTLRKRRGVKHNLENQGDGDSSEASLPSTPPDAQPLPTAPLYPPIHHHNTHLPTGATDYGLLMENIKNCYACGPFVGKFLIVGVLLDFIYLKVLDWVYPVELIDIAPDVS